MARIVRKERVTELYEAILELETPEECRQFFEDLCSPVEISAIEQRYAVAKLLTQDEVYLKILDETKASTATISRVNRVITGGNGILQKVIEKVRKKHES
ncbi:MAG: YerC/YecD family TrpR-related protein [Lachnospiraceae bacterium]|nr:YerC/YecD family TrpR-related protein [Lachnospiraceae bacterium]